MVKMMDKQSLDCILDKMPDRIRIPLERTRSAYEDKATEIVLRRDAPICIYERKTKSTHLMLSVPQICRVYH